MQTVRKETLVKQKLLKFHETNQGFKIASIPSNKVSYARFLIRRQGKKCTSLKTFCKSILSFSGQREVQDLTGIEPTIEAKVATGVVRTSLHCFFPDEDVNW